MLEGANDRTDNWRSALGRAVGRLGEPVVRTAVRQAMKILGRNFVFGRTIDEALKRAAPERRQGLSHSFDMLGEAAKTYADAARYAEAYGGALDRIAEGSRGGFRSSPGISVKLTALHPRYECSHAAEAVAAILPVVRELALKAAKADVHFTIDAEEADRLELRSTCSRLCSPMTNCSPAAGAGSGSRFRPIRSARSRCANGSRRPPARTAAS